MQDAKASPGRSPEVVKGRSPEVVKDELGSMYMDVYRYPVDTDTSIYHFLK
jgi:hypothetical protein